ncbi:MAG: cache domain-containing protein [Helicobacteraceae bacterium]
MFQKSFGGGIKLKLILFISLVVVVTASVVSYFSYTIAKDQYTSRILNEELTSKIDAIAIRAEAFIDTSLNAARQMSMDPYVVSWIERGEPSDDLQGYFEYCQSLLKATNQFATFFVSDKTLKHYTENSILKTISKANPADQWYFAAKDQSTPYTLNVGLSEKDKKMYLFVNSKMVYKGKFYGITGVGARLDEIVDFVVNSKLGSGSSSFMVDSSGLIQIHKDKSKIKKENAAHTIKELAKLLDKRDHSISYKDKNGKHFLLTLRYIKSIDWYLVGVIDRDEILRDLQKLFYSILLTTGLAIVFATALAFFISKTFETTLKNS